MSERSHNADDKVLNGILDVLMADFGSVQIICTKVNADGNTECVFKGRGDFYARLGAAREWLLRNDERTRKDIQKEDNEP